MRPADLAAALAVPLAVGLALLTGPPDVGAGGASGGSQAARTAPIEQTTLVCPTLRLGPNPAEATAAAVTAPRLPARSQDASSAAARVRSDRGRVGTLARPGATWSGSSPAVARGLRVDATGGLAAGLAGAVGAHFDARARGLATAACARPEAQWWFVGAASTAGRSGVLHLANPTPGVAVVDLSFSGPAGPLESPAGGGIALAPGARRSLPLADLVPGADVVTVQVTARQGQVTAALSEVQRDALDPAGVELLPAAAAPRRTSLLTGVPDVPGRHRLAVTNTGGSAAVVRLEVLGARGPFTPTEVQDLRVPAGATLQRPLPAGVFDGDVSGLRLRADQPVTAAVQTTSGGPLADQSYAVAAEPVGATAAVPLLRGLPDLRGRLALSAVVDRAVTVDLEVLARDGRVLDRRTVDLGAGQTRVVPLGDGPAASVRLRSSEPAGLLATVLWSQDDTDGTLRSGFPLPPLHATVARPSVRYRLVP